MPRVHFSSAFLLFAYFDLFRCVVLGLLGALGGVVSGSIRGVLLEEVGRGFIRMLPILVYRLCVGMLLLASYL